MDKSIYSMTKEEFYNHYKALNSILYDTKKTIKDCNVLWEKISNKEKIKLMRDIDLIHYNKIHNIKEVRGREKLKLQRQEFFNKIQSILKKVNRTSNDVFMARYYSKYDSEKLKVFTSKLTKEDKLIIENNKEYFENLFPKKEIYNNKLKYLHSSVLEVKPNLDKLMTGIKDFMYQIKHKHEFQNRMKKRLELMKYSDIDRLREGYNKDNNTYLIILTNNKKRVKLIHRTLDKDEAISVFEKTVKKNQNVVLPQVYMGEKRKIDYELLLVKVTDEVDSEGYFRDPSTGKFIKTIVSNKDNMVIINKSNIYIENDFFVYGYHPQKQRKRFVWIKENLIDTYISQKKTMSVRAYGNKVFLFNEDMSDFRLIICRNGLEADSLIDKMKSTYEGNKYIHFLYKLRVIDEMKRHMLLIREKTGWDYRAITHPYFYVKEDERI